MCIICQLERWVRRTFWKLPSLVAPLTAVWALSQFLPPSFRLEVSFTRLVCALVVVGPAVFLDGVVPRLSLWRDQREAHARAQHQLEEARRQNLRRNATRRCRNCLNPYRDQNPGPGGKYTCHYCGQQSKRPILEDWTQDVAASLGVATAGGAAGGAVSMVYSLRNVFGDHRPRERKALLKNERAEESRSEKKRRMAEEKKKERRERKLMEEEERKHREEVARLVEEQRKLRPVEPEPVKEVVKKETVKRSEKKKAESEESERRVMMSRECERKQVFDRTREKVNKPAVNTARYFDRVRGSFFGRNAQSTAAPVAKVNQPAAVGSVIAKPIVNGDARPAGTFSQPIVPPPKKGWRELFKCSSVVSREPDTNSASIVNPNGQQETTVATEHKVIPSIVDNGRDLKRSLHLSSYSSPNTLKLQFAQPSLLPFEEIGERSMVEDIKLFDDPCYVPNDASRIGAMSKSFDKLSHDIGKFVGTKTVEDPLVHKALRETRKPSPIGSSLSKSRVSEEKQGSCKPIQPELLSSNLDDSSNAPTWQMWGSPSDQDGPSCWFASLFHNRDVNHGKGQISQNGKNSPSLPGICTQKVSGHDHGYGGTYSPLGVGLDGNCQWVSNTTLPSPLPFDGENQSIAVDLIDEFAQHDVEYSSAGNSAPIYPIGMHHGREWSKEDPVFGEGGGELKFY